MFEELRDCLKVVILVNVSEDERDKIAKGNPSASVLACNDATELAGADLPSAGPRDVDLIVFGAGVLAPAAVQLVSQFAQRDAILLFEADADWTPFADLAGTGAVDARVFSLHRLPGALVVGYEPGADFGTRTYAKLLSEFLEPLGRIVSGARVFVDGPFARPNLVGNWFLIGRPGCSFDGWACPEEKSLVAVDLSISGLSSLPRGAFSYCGALAAVSFPNELVEIGRSCFEGCCALVEVDLSNTRLAESGDCSFAGSGLDRLSLPSGLRVLDLRTLQATPMKTLDLSMCADLSGPDWRAHHDCRLEVRELRLPRRDFAGRIRGLMPGSRVEVLQVDIDADEAYALIAHLEEWGICRLQSVLPGLATPIECRRAPGRCLESVTDPASLATPSAVFVTRWQDFHWFELDFLRSIDMSALTLTEFPEGATLSHVYCLEIAILPNGLQVLPGGFFRGCFMLSRVDTSGCTALQWIGPGAFQCCSALAKFSFPRTVRDVGPWAFGGTAIEEVDLSETDAESAPFRDMIFLERLTLPRRCVTGLCGIPALHHLTAGQGSKGGRMDFGRHMRELRFESFHAPPEKAAGLQNARLHAEVAAAFALESIPSAPA